MNKMIRTLLLTSVLLGFLFILSGCNPPAMQTIEPSQTAFLIPLSNDTSQQAKLESESFLQQNKVAGKRVLIYNTWVDGNGYQPTHRLIIVERKPVTREWTEDKNSGTSAKNQGIVAESKESIGFTARMTCNAQIDEVNAVKFLYRYNNKALDQIMDNELRSMVESSFVEECASRSLDQILTEKSVIMKAVNNKVLKYFAERGVTITTLGLKGELTYLNENIQESIDKKYQSAQDTITQKNINEKVISKAKADAEAIKTQAETITQTMKLKELDNQAKAIDKWNGEMPTYSGINGSSLFSIPTK
jgi:hypothetical protein